MSEVEVCCVFNCDGAYVRADWVGLVKNNVPLLLY
jgi:hypothetical protein